MHRSFSLTCLLIGLLFCGDIQGQWIRPDPEAGTPLLTNFLPKDYQAAAQNWCIVQDESGLIYVGNGKGILIYDGTSWRLIAVPNKGVVRSLAVWKRYVYAGARGDFGYLMSDGRGITKFMSLKDSIPVADREFTDVWDVHVDSSNVYFCTSTAIYRWNGQLIHVIKPNTSILTSFMAGGKLYAREAGFGISRLDGDTMKRIPGGDFFNDSRVSAIFPYGGDSLFITTSQGFYVYNGLSTKPLRTMYDTLYKKCRIYRGCVLPDGSFAFATLENGVLVTDRNGQLLRQFDKTIGLAEQIAFALFPDSDNGLWVGLNKGISRIEVFSPIVRYTDAIGAGTSVEAFARYQGNLFIGGSQSVLKLVPASDRTGAHFERIPDMPPQCWTLFPSHGTLLAGTTYDTQVIRHDAAKKAAAYDASAFCRSAVDSDLVYVAYPKGLGMLRFENQKWRDAGKIKNFDEDVRFIAAYQNKLWMSLRSGRIAVIDEREHIQDNPVIEYVYNSTVNSSKELNAALVWNNKLWLASARGLLRWDSSKNTFTSDSSIGSYLSDSLRTVSEWAEDQQGDLWLLTHYQGRSELAELRLMPDGSYQTVTTRFSRFQDFEIYEIFAEKDFVWFGGPDGVIRCERRPTLSSGRTLPTLLRNVTLNYDSLVFAGGATDSQTSTYTFDYAHNTVRFEVGLAAYDKPAGTRYRFKLDGFDNDWSSWSASGIRDYTNIPPGRYQFHARAMDIYQNVAPEVSFYFRVMPPWYRTWWSYSLYVLIVFSLITVGAKWRYRRLENEKAKLESLVRQRTLTIEEKVRELAILNDKKNEFVGIVAHDLRSPLATLIGYMDLISLELQDVPLDTEKIGQDISRLSRVASHMTHFITELLDISAIESGKIVLERESVSMKYIMHDCEDLYRRQADKKNIELHVDYDTPIPNINVDKSKISSVIDNLLSNAIKFSHPGGQVRVYFENHSNEVITHVQDSGQGLSEDDLQKVFTSFKRLSSKPTGGEPSTGLGLAIVKKIVELHHGRVWVKSKLGKGSTFSFSLPV